MIGGGLQMARAVGFRGILDLAAGSLLGASLQLRQRVASRRSTLDRAGPRPPGQISIHPGDSTGCVPCGARQQRKGPREGQARAGEVGGWEDRGEGEMEMEMKGSGWLGSRRVMQRLAGERPLFLPPPSARPPPGAWTDRPQTTKGTLTSPRAGTRPDPLSATTSPTRARSHGPRPPPSIPLLTPPTGPPRRSLPPRAPAARMLSTPASTPRRRCMSTGPPSSLLQSIRPYSLLLLPTESSAICPSTTRGSLLAYPPSPPTTTRLPPRPPLFLPRVLGLSRRLHTAAAIRPSFPPSRPSRA